MLFTNESDTFFWPASNIHPTHQIYADFDAKAPIESGGFWAFTFERPGFWRYHNHLGTERSGLVVVGGDPIEPPVPLVLTTEGLEFGEPSDLSLTQYMELYESDNAMTRFLREYGPSETVKSLLEGSKRTNADCHQRAHDAGRMAYELFGAAAFYLSSHECQAGTYHGATEALFRDRGTTNLREDVSVLCSYASVSFYYLQCLHGVGHGLMAWTSYELHDALSLCEELELPRDHRACYSGVFMENVIGGLSGLMGHVTEYLSDDPHYPCNALDEQYVQMVLLLSEHEDDDPVRQRLQQSCRDLRRSSGGGTPLLLPQSRVGMWADSVSGIRDAPSRFAVLRNSPTNRAYCIEGAVQNRFWEVSGADEALSMCAMATDRRDRFACNQTIVFRAQELYETTEAFSAFCDRVDESFRAWCHSKEIVQVGKESP